MVPSIDGPVFWDLLYHLSSGSFHPLAHPSNLLVPLLHSISGCQISLHLPLIRTLVITFRTLVAQFCPTLCDPMDCSPLAALSMEFSKQEYWNRLLFPSPGDLPQWSNSGLLHCRQILYPLSYQGSLWLHLTQLNNSEDSQVMWIVMNPPANAENVRDLDWMPGWRRSPGRGHGNALQYSCLENPLDRGAWWATVHGVAKSQTWLSMQVNDAG